MWSDMGLQMCWTLGHFRLVGPASGRTFVDICVLYMLVRVFSSFASLCGVIPYCLVRYLVSRVFIARSLLV